MTIPFLVKKWLIRSGLARFLPVTRRLAPGGSDFLQYYSDRILSAPIEELLDPATFPEVPGFDVIDLNQASPRFDSPVTGGRVQADRSGMTHPRGLPALRDAIASAYRDRDGRAYDSATEIVVTHGATGAYAATLDAIINPGDRVVLFAPTSPMFALGAQSRRAQIRWVPTGVDENGRATIDLIAMEKAIRGAKLIVLSEPLVPTGAMLTAEQRDRLARAACRSDALVYVDESFSRYRYEDAQPSLVTLPGMRGRTIVAGSLSQGDGLASTRVGWLAGPEPIIRACTLTVSLSAPYIPAICQQIALRAVQADEDLFGPVLEEFRAKRRYTMERLRAMGLAPAMPAGGYFCWLPVTSLGMDGRTFAERLLKEQRVLVGPGVAFGPGGDGHVRLSFAAEDGRLREGLARLGKFITSLRPTPSEAEAPVAEAPLPVEDRPPSFSRV